MNSNINQANETRRTSTRLTPITDTSILPRQAVDAHRSSMGLHQVLDTTSHSNEARGPSSTLHPPSSAQGPQNLFQPTTSQASLPTDASAPEEMPCQINEDLYRRLSSGQRSYFERYGVPFGINTEDPLVRYRRLYIYINADFL